jgi:microcin C transport system substrate-binding protein
MGYWRLIHCCILLATIVFLPQNVFGKPLHGIAMHGKPALAPDFSHFPYANPDAPTGGTLTQTVTGGFDSLNPFIIKGRAAAGLHLTHDRLMARSWNEPFSLYPLVAKSVELADDRSQITFYLNEEAHFHDGHSIDVGDIMATIDVMRQFGHPSARQNYGLISDIRTNGGHEITLTLSDDRTRETALILAMMPVLPAHQLSAREFNKTTLDPILGSGPYRIQSAEAGRSIVYERVDDYWAADLPVNRGHFNFHQIEFDYYRDDSIARQAFIAGEANFKRIWDGLAWAKKYNRDQIGVTFEQLDHHRPEWRRSIILNTRRTPFDDIRVRQAFDLAFNFDWINKHLFAGVYQRIASYFPNSELAATGLPSEDELAILTPYAEYLSPETFGPAYTPPVTDGGGPVAHRNNLRRAMDLLNNAGWKIIDGRMTNGQGRQMMLEILLNDPTQEKIALEFARSLDRLGISAKVRTVDSAEYITRMDQFDFDITINKWISTLSPGAEQVSYWGSTAADISGTKNYAGIKNPAVDSMIDHMVSAQTRDKLITATHALDRVLTHGHYTIPLYYLGKDLVAYDDAINRPSDTPLYGLVIETWWMDADPPSN